MNDFDFSPGEEVICKNHDEYDLLVVLRCLENEIECFEYNPQHAFLIKKDEVERL